MTTTPALSRYEEVVMTQVMRDGTLAEPATETVSEPLADLLTRQRFALLNPLTVEEMDWSDLPSQPLENPAAKIRSHLMPRLVRLHELNKAQRLALIARIERYQKRGSAFFCALLETQASAERVAGHLQEQLVQRRKGDSRRWWLRFYDPLVFRHLCWQWQDEHLDRLLGPISAWCWQGEGGQWQRRRYQAETPPRFSYLFLEPQHWAKIDRITLLNACLMNLQVFAPQQPQTPGLWRWVDELIVRARNIPLASDRDCQRYVEQAVCHHPDIHAHPELRARLDRIREQGGSYITACKDLEAATLERLAADMNPRITRKEAP